MLFYFRQKPKKTPFQLVKGLPGTSTPSNSLPTTPTAGVAPNFPGPKPADANILLPPHKPTPTAAKTNSTDPANVSNLLDRAGQSFFNAKMKVSPQKDSQQVSSGITFGASSSISTPVSGAQSQKIAANNPQKPSVSPQQQAAKLTSPKNFMDIFSSFAKTFTPPSTTSASSQAKLPLVQTSSTGFKTSQQQHEHNKSSENVMNNPLAYSLAATTSSSVKTLYDAATALSNSIPVQHKSVSSTSNKPLSLAVTTTVSSSSRPSPAMLSTTVPRSVHSTPTAAAQKPSYSSALSVPRPAHSNPQATATPRPAYSTPVSSALSSMIRPTAAAAHAPPAHGSKPPSSSSGKTKEAAIQKESIIAEISNRLRATGNTKSMQLIEQLKGLTFEQLLQVKTSMESKNKESNKQQKQQSETQIQRQAEQAAKQKQAKEQAERQRKAEEQAARQRDEKAAIQRAAEERASIQRAFAEEQNARIKAAEEKVARQKAAEEQAARQRAAEEQAARQRAAEEQAARQRAAEEQAVRQRAAEEQAARQRAAEEQAARQKAAEEQAARQRAADEKVRQRNEQKQRESELLQKQIEQQRLAEHKKRVYELEQEQARQRARDVQQKLKAAATSTSYKHPDSNSQQRQQQQLAQQQLQNIYGQSRAHQQPAKSPSSSWSATTSPSVAPASATPSYTSSGTFLGQPVPTSPSPTARSTPGFQPLSPQQHNSHSPDVLRRQHQQQHQQQGET